MSKLVELLHQNAEIEKKAYSQFVESFTSASIQAAVKAGIPFEKAASLVKQACEQESSELDIRAVNFTLMEKAAEEILRLEAVMADLEKSASVLARKEEVKEPMSKLAQLGFSEAELAAMQSVDAGILEKVANLTAAPASLGTPVGIQREKTDPILDFVYG